MAVVAESSSPLYDIEYGEYTSNNIMYAYSSSRTRGELTTVESARAVNMLRARVERVCVRTRVAHARWAVKWVAGIFVRVWYSRECASAACER